MDDIKELAIDIDVPLVTLGEKNHSMSKSGGADVAVPIEELLTTMKKRLDGVPGKPFQARSIAISRLPGWVHKKKKEIYEPNLVAIGPYHRGKESLRTMEEHKWSVLRDFLARNENVGLEVYLQAMKSVESQARQCYSETVNLKSDEFVMMLLLDGCFILEWFTKYANSSENKSFCFVGWAGCELLSDMCLLENQVPFFVIHKLLAIRDRDVVAGSLNCERRCPLLELFSDVLQNNFHFYLTQFKQPPMSCHDVNHLLHLCHTGVVLTSQPHSEVPSWDGEPSDAAPMVKRRKGRMSIPCVSELRDAGIKFKRKKKPKSMLDISFKNGIIEMPCLQMEVPKIKILWNMIAFEQSREPLGLPQTLSSYLALMDTLINTEKDVAILEQSGIPDNLFQNAEEAAIFFNQFDRFFILNYGDHYYYDLFRDVGEYCESTWHRYRARLMQDYFSNPWTIISVAVVTVLLILTAVQTYYSVAN